MDVIKIKCATNRDGEACAYLTDDHGVAPQGGREARNRGRLGQGPMAPLILKRAPIGDNQDDYDLLENGVVVGRIFKVPVAPPDCPWMWASGHSAATVTCAAHGYEATREAAMAAFAKSWRRET
jgi:hypothetical protein